MISADAWLLAGATVAAIGIPQWIMHQQNKKQWRDVLSTFFLILKEYPLHRHEEDGRITYPRVELPSVFRPNGQS